MEFNKLTAQPEESNETGLQKIGAFSNNVPNNDKDALIGVRTSAGGKTELYKTPEVNVENDNFYEKTEDEQVVIRATFAEIEAKDTKLVTKTTEELRAVGEKKLIAQTESRAKVLNSANALRRKELGLAPRGTSWNYSAKP